MDNHRVKTLQKDQNWRMKCEKHGGSVMVIKNVVIERGDLRQAAIDQEAL